MLEEAIVATLADLAPVYPAYLPERVDRPAIVYRRISSIRSLNHDGPIDIVEARIQITAHTDTHPDALVLARTIRKRLHGKSGGMAGADILLLEVDNEIDLGWTPDAEGWEITLDVLAKYKE